MRIASLVPSATEILFSLGFGDRVVAVTHECDFPLAAAKLPHLTKTVLPPGLSAGEIDAEVKRITGEGRALYELDVELLERLEVDLIVTQEVCRVCAVSYDDVLTIAERLPGRPNVLSLDPSTLGAVIADVRRAADAVGQPQMGVELEMALNRRLEDVKQNVAGAPRPAVIALEWLDPPFSAGHWLPEMIEVAGGREMLGHAGGRSEQLDWATVQASAADHVVVLPCGWGLDRAEAEAAAHAERLRGIGAANIHVTDAAASFSRPGPRLIDGVELLAHLLHPGLQPDPGTIPYTRSWQPQ